MRIVDPWNPKTLSGPTWWCPCRCLRFEPGAPRGANARNFDLRSSWSKRAHALESVPRFFMAIVRACPLRLIPRPKIGLKFFALGPITRGASVGISPGGQKRYPPKKRHKVRSRHIYLEGEGVPVSGFAPGAGKRGTRRDRSARAGRR